MVDLPTMQPVGAIDSPAQAPEAGPAAPGFRDLLASLERLGAEHRELPPVADAESLRSALARADAGFQTAMDLRRQLEAAFRGHRG
jgi:hypothetical protein